MFTNQRHRRSSARGLAAAVVVLLVAGCGGGSDESGPASTAAGSDPLTAALLGGRTFEEAEFEVEQLVQRCMTALGWEYTAVAPSATGAGGALGGGADLDAFAAESGYGVSTFDATVGAVGTGGDTSNPNMAYAATLAADEQAAYFTDLYGAVPADADPDAAISPGGCYGQASTAVYGEGTFERLNDQFDEVSSRMLADQRMIDANAEWSRCMSAAGYSYTTPDDAVRDVTARMTALGAQPDPAALAALRTAEIATATTDRACAREVGLDEVQQEVYLEISAQVAGGS